MLGDRADTAVDDPQVDIFTHVYLEQCIFECFDRTGDVTLEDEVERLDRTLLENLLQVFETDLLTSLGELSVALCGLTLLGNLTSRAVVGRHQKLVACAWH